MRKSKDVTKYAIGWQIVRVECRSLDSWEDKVAHAMAYLDRNANKHSWERVANWLEGLAKGYRGKRDHTAMIVEGLANDLIARKAEFSSDVDTDDGADVSRVTSSVLKELYKDLCKRSKKWLENGYVHAEQSAMEDMLASALAVRGVNVGHENQLAKRDEARAMGDNKHKFFF